MSKTFNFTKPAIDALPLPAPGKRAEYRDEKIPGLMLRVTSSGARTFSVQRRVKNGSPQRVTIGQFPLVTIEMARKAAAAANSEFATGIDPTHRARERRRERTLGDLWQLYRERYAIPQGIRRLGDLQAIFELYLGEVPDEPAKKHGRKREKPKAGVNWTRRKASEITADDVGRWHQRIGAEVGQVTANRALELLRAIYNRCKRMGLYGGENPAEHAEPFKEHERERYLRNDEIPRFFQAVESAVTPTMRDALLMCLLTGARKSSVLAMRFDQVDFANERWHVPGELSKNGDPLVLPLTSAAMLILNARLADAQADVAARRAAGEKDAALGFVFPSTTSASGHVEDVKKAWRQVVKAAELQDVRLHDLRRSLGSWMVNSGASLAIIAGALGHKDAKSTAVYARLAVDPVRQAMERAQALMRAAGNAGGDEGKVQPLQRSAKG